MDTAMALPQNLYFSVFCTPRTIHTHVRCRPRQGGLYPRTPNWSSCLTRATQAWLAQLCLAAGAHERAAACNAEASGHFTGKHEVELQNTESNKTSTSLWNTPREDKICKYTLRKTKVVDHNKRNFHHSLQQSFNTEKNHHIALPGHPPAAPRISSQCWSLFKVVHLITLITFSSSLPLDCQVANISKGVFHFWMLNPPCHCWTGRSAVNLVLKPRAI